jgi:ABC-2 type transport system permease protein
MNVLAGTIRLTRLAARRDRITLPVWILGMSAFLATTTAMFVNTLVTYADRVQEAELPTNNAGLRMLGLTSGPTVGGAVMMRDFVLLAVLAALMNVLAVVRHTRQSEELGRAEIVGSTVVGRYADLAAAVIVVVAADVLLAVALALATVANGLSGSGAFTAGVAIAAVGVVFAGVAAVTVQLASSARGAIGLSAAVVGVAFLFSGIGNMLGSADSHALRVTSAWPSWLSPIGWGQQMRPFGGDHLWPLVLFAALFVCLLGVAALLVSHRDVGAGLWHQRPGDAHAAASLLSPTGLVFRLQRGTLLGWIVGMLTFGLIFGSMSEQIQHVQGSAREFYARMGGTDRILEAYDASMVGFAAMMVAIYLVQMMLRMRADEARGTLEPLLATGVSRRRWMLGYLLNAVGGSLALMLVFSLSMGLAAGQVLGGTTTQVRDLFVAALVQLPAIFVVGAVVLAAVGILPRWATPISWGLLMAALVLGPMFGPPLGLSQQVLNLSPFTHVPNVPATEVTASPLVILTGVGAVLTVVGALAMRRRSLVLPA